MTVKIPTSVYKYAFTAVLSIVLAGGLFTAVKIYNKRIFDKGVAYEVARQEAFNNLFKPVSHKLAQDTVKAEDKRNDQTTNIQKERVTGITEAFLERSNKEAIQTGKELGRAAAIAEYRAKGGCLVEHYAPDSKLLLNGQSQQRDIFGSVVGVDSSDKTGEVR